MCAGVYTGVVCIGAVIFVVDDVDLVVFCRCHARRPTASRFAAIFFLRMSCSLADLSTMSSVPHFFGDKMKPEPA